MSENIFQAKISHKMNRFFSLIKFKDVCVNAFVPSKCTLFATKFAQNL